MMNKPSVSNLEDFIDLFERDKRLDRTILFTDNTTLVDVLFDTFVSPPNKIFVLWNRIPIIRGSARNKVIDGKE